MIRCFLRTASAIFLLFACLSAARADDIAAHRPRQGALPSWFKPANEFDLAAESRRPLTPEDAHHALSYFFFEQQTHVRETASTRYYAYRVTSDSGLSSAAEISQHFDPSYASLELHFLRVWRDGTPQDRLNLDEIKVIRQERDLERRMFNGELSAITTLADIRKGDIVECAYTIRGANPVFGGKFIDSISVGWGSPVAFERIRVLMAPERPLHWRVRGNAHLEHQIAVSPDGTADHTWTARHLAPIDGEEDAPSWHVQYPFLSLSEFATWDEVRAWARPLYDQPRDNDALRTQALALTARADTPEKKLLALLDFVQREVRYLGVELGANSHRPHPPAQVLRQRFGDCKDKVTLFCALAAAAGLEAHPVLVSSYQQQGVADELPSPYAFNHVIALVPLGGESFWVDPTSLHDRGGLRHRDFSFASRGLVIRETAGAPGLHAIPARPESRPRLEVTQDFSYEKIGDPAKLAVSYRYSGDSACNLRGYLANNTKEEVTREFTDRQKRAFPSFVLASPLTWRDDADRNTVELELHGTVPELWQQPGDKAAARTAEFYPWELHSVTAQPDSLTRTAPLKLAHPWEIIVRTNIHLVGKWELTPDNKTFETPWYLLHMESRYADQVFRIVYTWQSRADHVLAADLPKHVAELARIRKEIGYTLQHGAGAATETADAGEPPAAPASSFKLNWPAVLLVAALLFGWARFALWLDRQSSDAPPPLVDRHLRGIGGWLILPALGLALRPFVLLYGLAGTANAYFNARVWENLGNSALTSYRPGFVPLLVFELSANTSLFALSVITAVFFFRAKRQAPRLVIALLLGFVGVLAIDDLGNRLIGNVATEKSIGEVADLIRAAIGAAVWVPYFIVSRRVKATFVN